MAKSIFIAAALLLAVAASAQAVPPQKAEGPAAPSVARLQEGRVVLDGKPLFFIRARVLSLPPVDRARIISDRLARLADTPSFHVDSLAAIDGDTTTDIAVGDTVVMTVTDTDAASEGRPRRALADERVRVMRVALAAYQREHSLEKQLLGGLYSVAATVTLVVLLVLLGRFCARLVARIESWRGVRIRSLRFQSVELLHEDRIVALLVGGAKALRLLMVVGLLCLYVPLVFSFFPRTSGFAARLFDYLAAPLEKIGSAALSSLPNLFFIAVILAVTWFGIKFTRLLFTEIERRTITLPGFYPEWARPTFKIVRFLIIAFAAAVAFPYIPGSDSPAFKGISVFLGVLLSLGSTSAVANVVAGIILTYMRAFSLGDRVQIAETVGDVVEKTLLVSRIRTIKNVDITIPNSMVLGSHIINYSSSAKAYGLILHTGVSIGYDVPWRRVHELLVDAARCTEHILALPEPFVFQTALNDFYVAYELNAYTDAPSKMASIYSELHQNIQDKFNEAGVEIMSPHYAQIRDGNKAAIPERYLPEGYRPGAIRIQPAGEPAGEGSGDGGGR